METAKQTIFLTGGSGFVGTAIIHELLNRNYNVIALVHRHDLPIKSEHIRFAKGDLTNSQSLREGMSGCDAVVHLIGIIAPRPEQGITFESVHVKGTQAVVDAAKAAGVRRFIHMSAMGARPDAPTDYHKTKYRGEEYVRSSGLDWTIFRPSLIHGPGGEFMHMEKQWAAGKAAPYLFMPYFGAGVFGTGGAGKLQPVFVTDVARAFVDALEKPQTIGQVYNLGGPEELTWPQLHHTSAEAIVGHRKAVVPLPAWYAKLLATVVPRSLLPFNRDQVVMSQENNTGDISSFQRDFGWEPAPFGESLRSYAGQL